MFGVSCSSVGLALLILLVICSISEIARYRVKFILYMLASTFFATWTIPLMLFRIHDWRNALIPAWQLKWFAKLLGCNYIIRGHNNIIKDSGAIVLINHQSSLDVIVLAELWPILEHCTVIAKKQVLWLGSYGLATWLWGTIFIDKKKGSSAQDTLNSTAEIIKKRKAKVLMFPEGTRHSNNSLLPFKKGAFHLAIETQMPLQPIVVSKYYYIDHDKKKFDSGTNYITILPPIPTSGLKKEDIPALIDKAYEVMNEEFQKSTQEAIKKYSGQVKVN
ncbi:1-acyl-sn-glycerol-3-phosphate acyltransferase alpha isoform X2 [Chelonus insularis]|nr:1-acyl-sn-glycerol-3-phosphate acyltransferase alpha isoform X2 [Chelonus insularis]